MKLIILDKHFETLGMIGVFNTLIWTRRYYEAGIFELHVPAEYFELMNSGMYLYRNDREELGVIREVNFREGQQGRAAGVLQGLFLRSAAQRSGDRPAGADHGHTGNHRTRSRDEVLHQPDRHR